MNMLLTTMSIILFGTLMLSFNNIQAINLEEGLDNQYSTVAMGLAQSVIDEAKVKAFDEKTVASPAKDTSGFTASANFGRDASETIPNPDTLATSGGSFATRKPGFWSAVQFDDIDDYNGYVRIMPKGFGYEGDTITVAVSYAGHSTPDSLKTYKTYLKVMKVTVKNARLLSHPLSLSYGFSY